MPRDKMVGLVETMQMTADGLRPTACGLYADKIRIIEGAADKTRPTDGRKEK